MFGKKKKLAEQKAAEEAKRQREALAPSTDSAQDDDFDFLESEIILDDEVEAEVLTDEEAAQLDELQAVLMGGDSANENEPEEEKAEDAEAPQEPDTTEVEPELKEESAPAEPQEEAADVAQEETSEEADPATPEDDEAEETAEEETEEAEAENEEESEDSDESEEQEEAEDETEEDESEEADESEEEVVYVVDGPEDDDEVVRPARLVKLPHLIDYMIAQGMSRNVKVKVALMLAQTYNKFKDSPEDKKICMQCMAKMMQELMKK